MPQFRKLHTKTLESLDVNSMSSDFVRLTWVLLPLIVCKEGRGMLYPAWVRSKMYPLRDDVTQEMIYQALGEFINLGMIEAYSVGDRRFFQIVSWNEYQNTAREAASPYPAPTQELVTTNSGQGEADYARTTSISISTSMSTSDEEVYEYDETAQEKADIVTALCNVVRRAGPTNIETLDLADALLEMEVTPERIREFGAWWEPFGEGKPWTKQILAFWDDFENGLVPFFARDRKEHTAVQGEDGGYYV